MKRVKDTYDKCSIKQKMAVITGLVAFIIGWMLSIWGFFIPPVGEIADSVLWVLGQSLVYCGSILGISTYFSSESTKMKRDMQRYFDKKERLQIERMKIRQGIDVGELPNDTDDEDDE